METYLMKAGPKKTALELLKLGKANKNSKQIIISIRIAVQEGATIADFRLMLK